MSGNPGDSGDSRDVTPSPSLSLDATVERVLARMRRLPTEERLTDVQRHVYADFNQRTQRLAHLLERKATLSASDMRQLTEYVRDVLEREAIPVDEARLLGLLHKVLAKVATAPVGDLPRAAPGDLPDERSTG